MLACVPCPLTAQVVVVDPFIRKHHQLLNLLRFCELCIVHKVERVELITTLDENQAVAT